MVAGLGGTGIRGWGAHCVCVAIKHPRGEEAMGSWAPVLQPATHPLAMGGCRWDGGQGVPRRG